MSFGELGGGHRQAQRRVLPGGRSRVLGHCLLWGDQGEDSAPGSSRERRHPVRRGWVRVFGCKPQMAFSGEGFVTGAVVPEGNAADIGQLVTIAECLMENTGVVPRMMSLDDGYNSAGGLAALREKGIETVSFSGTHGKKLLGE